MLTSLSTLPAGPVPLTWCTQRACTKARYIRPSARMAAMSTAAGGYTTNFIHAENAMLARKTGTPASGLGFLDPKNPLTQEDCGWRRALPCSWQRALSRSEP